MSVCTWFHPVPSACHAESLTPIPQVGTLAAALVHQSVLPLSLAPHHRAFDHQLAFSLERGLPSVLSSLSSHRLPFPSLAFDFIHASHCPPFASKAGQEIHHGGAPPPIRGKPSLFLLCFLVQFLLVLLPKYPSICSSPPAVRVFFLEVHRLLRPGGFFVLAGPPVAWPGMRHWNRTRLLAKRMCWQLKQLTVRGQWCGKRHHWDSAS